MQGYREESKHMAENTQEFSGLHSVMLTNIVIHISIYSSVYPQECQGVLDSLHK